VGAAVRGAKEKEKLKFYGRWNIMESDETLAKLIEKHSKQPLGLRAHLKGVAMASPLGKRLWPEEHAVFIQVMEKLKQPQTLATVEPA